MRGNLAVSRKRAVREVFTGKDCLGTVWRNQQGVLYSVGRGAKR